MADPIPSPSGATHTPAKAAVVAIIIAVLAVAAYFIFRPGGWTPPAGNQPTPPAEQTNQEPTPSPTPNEVYSYVGEVQAVGNGQITVLAKKDLNLLEEDATLTVKADANTQVIRRTIPRELPEDGGAGLFSQETIALSDVQVGNQVTVVSATNIRGVSEFTASSVEVLNIK
ncbi:MAG: hypothetical protein U1C53_03265 [Candidatus Veblenbacteria bacterium]|nr:hypothetical protein [Candidatus Veblenbacteria bacterium]MDZ4230134.1 hypothetical protein [Candidatus Veblenbacteria bacterium]